MKKYRPFVSVIIVNFNGSRLLKECLPAVLNQDYGSQNYEVIVVDNDSSDNSCAFVKRTFKGLVKLVESPENSGFTGGNNLGYSHAKGESIVLLNNDVVVTRNWLSELVKASEPENVGLVSSKLYYSVPFLPLQIVTPLIQRSQIDSSIDFSPIGVIIESIACETQKLTDMVWYKKGFSLPKKTDIITRWTVGDAYAYLPFVKGRKTQAYTLTLHGYDTDQDIPIPYSVKLGKHTLVEGVLSPKQVAHHRIVIPSELAEKHFIWHIQNAGNIVLHDGYSKDSGSLLTMVGTRLLEFYEQDSEYFRTPKNLLAVCGASCLVKRQVIENIGFLDGNFFMYYEDLDFSLRAWRSGYDIVYAPDSIGYHKHRATTGREVSHFFLTQTEKNHLFFLYTHFPWVTVLIQTLIYLLRFFVSALSAGIMRFSENLARYNRALTYYDARKQVLIGLIRHMPVLLKNRWFWARHSTRGYNEMRKLMY